MTERGPSEAERTGPEAPPFFPSLFSRRLLRAFGVLAIAVVIAVVVSQAALVLLVIFAGVLFSLFLSGLARLLHRWLRLPYWLALTIIVLALLGLGASLGTWVGPRAAAQLVALFERLPRAVDQLVGGTRWREWTHALSRPPHGGGAHELGELLGRATGIVTTAAKIGGAGVVMFFIGVYGAAQPGIYKRGLLRIVPPAARPRAEAILDEVVRALRRWLAGRIVAMFVIGVGTTIVFWFLDVPLPFALGLLAGLLTFIEYVGAILSAVPAILLALERSLSLAIWVIVLFTGVHALEGYVITPLVTRRTVRFPPGFTLAVQILMSALFGVPGLTLATPIAVIIVLLVERLWIESTLGEAPIPKAGSPAPGRRRWSFFRGRGGSRSKEEVP